ncbi:phosphoglycerate kinase [Candidatus Dependentiae bacterium]|nr:phosphoglycerate kinase [Candidatus Dependentiae bacterium]
MNTSFLHKAFLQHQRVFVRADLNVPINEQGSIKNDKRLKAILPTINYIQKHGGKVILATHIGRPLNNHLEHHLSTRNLIPWFESQGFRVDFQPDLLEAQKNSYLNPEHIMMLENLRFFLGEKNYSMPFAELLSNVADIYVNDAFGTMHRNDTSVSILPQFFLPHNRGWGLLVEAELQALESLHDAPKQPCMLVLGGAKVSDKIPLIKNFLLHTTPPTAIMLGGKIALPFLAMQGFNLGCSKPKQEDLSAAREVLALLTQTSLVLPVDLTVCSNPSAPENAQTKNITDLAEDDVVIDIGAKTVQLFVEKLSTTKTVFVNGTMGINETIYDSEGTTKLLQAIAALSAMKIIGGGDCGAAVEKLGLTNQMTFVSTGGGATLAYLGCENPWAILPGLKALGPAA